MIMKIVEWKTAEWDNKPLLFTSSKVKHRLDSFQEKKTVNLSKREFILNT